MPSGIYFQNVDTEPQEYLPDGHIDKAGNLLKRPIAWYGQVGCGPIEGGKSIYSICYPP